MSEIFKRQFDVKLPLPNRQSKHEDYWVERKGVTKCPACGNVHFLKRWFASERDLKNHLHKGSITIAREQLCRACRTVKNHEFDGEVMVENIPAEYRQECMNIVDNFSALAIAKDPQHRIISTAGFGGGYRITATNNEMADHLARKIHHAFEGSKLSYSRAPGPKNIDRTHIKFPKKTTKGRMRTK